MSEKQQLIRDEGIRLKPYTCTAGKITIGVGRNLEGNPLKDFEVMRLLSARPHIAVQNTPIAKLRDLLLQDFYRNGITREEAMFLFENDYNETTRSLADAFPWLEKAPAEVRQILTNMAFQMGVKGLKKFIGTMPLIENGQYKTAAANLEKSLWARQTPNRAGRLIKRLQQV